MKTDAGLCSTGGGGCVCGNVTMGGGCEASDGCEEDGKLGALVRTAEVGVGFESMTCKSAIAVPCIVHRPSEAPVAGTKAVKSQ